MNQMIIEFYSQIEQNKIRNNMNSKYWMYSIESILTKEEGVSKRYLKVLFFNRMMNENNNLMRLYLNVNGEIIEKDDFVISSLYHDKNIMGFILKRDLIDESKDIMIEGYVIDGKKYELPKENFINGFSVNNNEQKYHALKDFTHELTDEMIIAPYFDDDKWICACGYTNKIENGICQICASKKDKMKDIADIDTKLLILMHLGEGIHVNTSQTVVTYINEYINKISYKYGIPKEELYQKIDIEKYETEQQQLIDQFVDEYIKSNEIKYNMSKTFEECLNTYCSGICNDVILKDKVLEKLNIPKLKEDYDDFCSLNKEKQKARKRKIRMFFVFIILIIGIFAGFQIMKKINGSKYQGIAIIDTYENRKEACSKSKIFDNIVNPELKQIMKKGQYCEIPLEFTQDEKIKIQKDGNKTIRPLDDNHVLIKEDKEVDKNTIRTTIYIADLDGEKVYGDTKANYTTTTLKDNLPINKATYVNNKLYSTDNYEYENKLDYTITRILKTESGNLVYACFYKNGKIKEIFKEDPYGDTEKYTYTYLNNEISRIVEKNTDYTRSRIHKNGLPIKYEYNNQENITTQLFYDKNGLLARSIGSINNSPYSKSEYSYDFEKGKFIIHEYIKNETDDKWRLSHLYVLDSFANDLLYDFDQLPYFGVTPYSEQDYLTNTIPGLGSKTNLKQEIYDGQGNHYLDAIRIDTSINETKKYSLNKFYSTLNGTLVTGEDTGDGVSMSISIYGDDKKLYHKDNIKKDDIIKFSIDVDNVEEIRIESSNDGKYDCGFLYLATSDLEVTKK